MKKIINLIIISMFVFKLHAQNINTKDASTEVTKDTNWHFGGISGLNFNQVSLSNWASGGESSYASNALLSLFGNYAKGKSIWDNALELGYGLMKFGEQDIRKSDDKIDFSSKYGYEIQEKWFLSTLANFKTQFADGYLYPEDLEKQRISDFMAPGYLLFALGIDHKPNENLSLFISPITSKSTFVLDDKLSNAGGFGVNSGDKMLTEIGAYFNAFAKKTIMKNIDLQTRLNLFSSYTKEPQNIDVNWEVLLNMSINKFITANLNTHLIYDHDIKIPDQDNPEKKGPKTQFKELFGIGFMYKF